MGKARRNRRRWGIQQGRKLRRRGACPCSDVRIEDPGPHLDSCEWARDDLDDEERDRQWEADFRAEIEADIAAGVAEYRQECADRRDAAIEISHPHLGLEEG